MNLEKNDVKAKGPSQRTIGHRGAGKWHKCFRIARICRPGDFFSSRRELVFGVAQEREGQVEGKGGEGLLSSYNVL